MVTSYVVLISVKIDGCSFQSQLVRKIETFPMITRLAIKKKNSIRKLEHRIHFPFFLRKSWCPTEGEVHLAYL